MDLNLEVARLHECQTSYDELRVFYEGLPQLEPSRFDEKLMEISYQLSTPSTRCMTHCQRLPLLRYHYLIADYFSANEMLILEKSMRNLSPRFKYFETHYFKSLFGLDETVSDSAEVRAVTDRLIEFIRNAESVEENAFMIDINRFYNAIFQLNFKEDMKMEKKRDSLSRLRCNEVLQEED